MQSVGQFPEAPAWVPPRQNPQHFLHELVWTVLRFSLVAAA
ncbi:MAG: hypothetical protein ACRYFV_23110 [Janthinobacterium lividum]